MDAFMIRTAICDLENGPSPHEFTTYPLVDDFFVAKSHTGEPCFGVIFGNNFNLPASRETQGMSMEFYADFELRGNPSQVHTVGLLRCRDTTLTYQFAVMVEGYLSVARKPLYPAHLLKYIEDWEDLLNRIRHLSHQEEVGLWGELMVINSATDTNRILNSWHGPNGSTFDFSAKSLDLDVKTSTTGHKHRFSLAQVSPSPSAGDRYILSLCITEDNAGGLTVTDLVNAIRGKSVDRVTLEKRLLAVGYGDSYPYVRRFSEVASKLVRTEDIPSVHALDQGVTDVQFTSDLSVCSALDTLAAQTILGKLAAGAPR